MKKVILYPDIEEKKTMVEESVALSPLDSLVQCLDVMDFNAALVKSNPHRQSVVYEDGIDWINLTFVRHGK